MLERERRLAKAVEGLPAEVRQLLLEALMAPPERRAVLIGRLHQSTQTPQLVELLIDLEEDRLVGLELADALRASRP
jgi:hypothetical protein